MRGQVSPHSHTWLPYITPDGVRLAHEILTNSYSYNQTQGFIGDTNFPMTNKKLHFFFALRSVCTNSRFAQVRLRLGKKNKSFFDFCFVFLSPCTNFHFVQVRLHLSNANKKISFFSLHCVRFALTLASRKLGCGSERKTKVFLTFVLSFSRLALTLQLQKTKYSEKGLLCEYTCNVYNW